jgi:hypothetical protein
VIRVTFPVGEGVSPSGRIIGWNIVVHRQKIRTGSGEDANKEGESDGDDYLAKAVAADAGDNLMNLFPAKNYHYRFRLNYYLCVK